MDSVWWHRPVHIRTITLPVFIPQSWTFQLWCKFRYMPMPKKNGHGDVFLRVRINEKCSFHNHKTIKQHSNQISTPRAISSVIIILQRLLVRSEGVFRRQKFSSQSFLCSCWLILFLFGVFFLVIPGPAAWSCLVRLGPVWSGLVLLGLVWLPGLPYLAGFLSKIQQRPAANSHWAE